MRDVETLVYQRLIADTGTGGIVPLLGNASRIVHANESAVPSSPGLTFSVLSGVPGKIAGQSRDVFVTFAIFAENYLDIADRLNRLFNNRRNDLSLISGGAVQIGSAYSTFDFEGPDGYDDGLQVQKKDLRFRFVVSLKARDPI